MDILTIQELTGFLRELKTKGILDQEKLRIVVNKELKVRNLSSKAVIGGMSFYNDPAMSYMTELFNKDKIRACTIPFDEEVLNKSKNENVGLNKTEKKVISLLIEDSEYTSDELAAKIGVTKRTIERAFISLQNKKVIKRIGSKRDGSWSVRG